MDRRDVVKIIGLSLFALHLFIQPVNSAGENFVIKMATLAPEGSSWMKTFHELNAEVMKKTENALRFKIYPGGVLGDEQDMLRKMQIGQIHSAALTTGGLSVLCKELDVLQVPFLFENYGEVDYVLKRMDSLFKKCFEKKGYILLGWSEAGFIYLMSTTPISSVSDLKKVKVWTWEESPMAKAIFDEAGVAAIPLSVPDVLVGLQTKLVDVVYVPPTLAISLQWFTRIKYITDVPLAYLAGGIVVKKNIFNRLPQASQNTLIELFHRYLDQLKAVTRNENRQAIKVMAKHGVKVITPPKDQVEEFKKLSDKAMSHLGGETFPRKVLGEVTAHLQSYRREGR